MNDLIKATKSLILSIQAHPDYTGEENEEWTDLVNIAEDAIKQAEVGTSPLIKALQEQSYNIETQAGEKLVIVELNEAIKIIQEQSPSLESLIKRVEGLKYKIDEFSDQWKIPHNEAIDDVLEILRSTPVIKADNDFWFDQMNVRFPDLVRDIMDSDEYFKSTQP